jgi:hydroxyacylglutathione hydrolase
MLLRQLFDPALAQYSYLIGCQKTGEAIVVDPLRDIEPYLELAAANGLRITAVAETHIHADFVSGAQTFARRDPELRVLVSGEGGPDWQSEWAKGRLNTTVLKDKETFRIGGIEFTAVHSPGHTPEHMSYLVTDQGGGADAPMAALTGDFIFIGDVGRPDLLEQAAGIANTQEAGARQLFESLRKFGAQDDALLILPAHGAGSACGKALGAVPFSTLGYERRFNHALRLALESSEQDFVDFILSGQPDPPPYFARMKAVNRDGIGGAMEAVKPKEWPAMDVVEWTLGRILDTRMDREAFDAEHLPGAIHAPYPGAFFLTSAGSYVEADDKILLATASQAEAGEATRQLFRIGLDHVVGWAPINAVREAGLMKARTPRVDFADWDQSAITADQQVLDVRNRSEFEAGHLPNSLNIPYTRLAPRRGEIPQDKELLIHCGSGKRASLAASYLRALGYRAVHIDGTCTDCERIAAEQALAH